jgi:hypothetical protein
MGIVISSRLVLGGEPPSNDEIDANNPLIGYRNLVTAGNITATTELAGFPALHLANPATHLRWQGATSAADQFITMVLNAGEDIDYLGIARHNLGSARIPVSIETRAADGVTWIPIVAERMLAGDGPVIFRFTPQPASALRIRLQPGAGAPTLAVVYAGKLLVLQRRIYVGHTPMPLGRTTRIVSAKSESGNFLGRIVLSESTATSVQLQNLMPAWYRSEFDPFVAAAKESPFFFAWRPGDYPGEVGYAWLTGEPKPSNQRPNGMMQVTLELGGILK